MVTLALGLNLKKIQREKLVADANYAQSLGERLEISERAKRLAEEKAYALETVHSQNALLHASGHDSRQVILALNSAVAVLKRRGKPGDDPALIGMLQSSANYLNEIVTTTISGANIAAGDAQFVALGAFRGQALIEPLTMMFKTPFANKKLTLKVSVADDVMIISDKPLLMRALANLLSNCYQYTQTGGAHIALVLDEGRAMISITDTGSGMPADIMAALNSGGRARVRGNETTEGTGSGFGSAKRIVEMLRGTLKIFSSTSHGTEIRITLPAASVVVTPISTDELQAGLPEWTVLDFDQRRDFELELASSGSEPKPVLAVTYDDSTVTRGRLGQLVTMVAIKPVCRELTHHPLLLAASKKV